MDEKELKQIETKLMAINNIIAKLDPAIKVTAFEFLKPLVLGKQIEVPAGKAGRAQDEEHLPPKGDVRDFYGSFNPKKPADSALILAGWFYTQRGSASFTLEELDALFDEVGVGRPARLDMTLRSSMRKGKTLFQNSGHGAYRPTVYGENVFKTEMNLRPGKQS
jgi:hypothetical protein